MFAGENFFLNHFTAQAGGQQLILGPSLLGDIVVHQLNTGSLVVQGASWLASSRILTSTPPGRASEKPCFPGKASSG